MPDAAARAAFAPLQVAVLRAAHIAPHGAEVFALQPSDVLRSPAMPSRPASCIALITCERITLVLWGAAEDADAVLHAVLAHHGTLVHPTSIECFHGVDAVRHLLSLAAGLESSRVGETEILGQLRAAWCAAHEHGATDSALDALIQRVIAGARHVRGALPPSALARTLGDETLRVVAQRRSRPWSAARVLVVGTGDAAVSALEAVAPRAPMRLAVIGRTPARVHDVASRFGAEPLAWSALAAEVAVADVVVLAVRSAEPVLDARYARPAADAVWVDLGAPPLVANADHVRAAHYVSLAMLHAALRAEPTVTAAGTRAVQDELDRYSEEIQRRSSRMATARSA